MHKPFGYVKLGLLQRYVKIGLLQRHVKIGLLQHLETFLSISLQTHRLPRPSGQRPGNESAHQGSGKDLSLHALGMASVSEKSNKTNPQCFWLASTWLPAKLQVHGSAGLYFCDTFLLWMVAKSISHQRSETLVSDLLIQFNKRFGFNHGLNSWCETHFATIHSMVRPCKWRRPLTCKTARTSTTPPPPPRGFLGSTGLLTWEKQGVGVINNLMCHTRQLYEQSFEQFVLNGFNFN